MTLGKKMKSRVPVSLYAFQGFPSFSYVQKMFPKTSVQPAILDEFYEVFEKVGADARFVDTYHNVSLMKFAAQHSLDQEFLDKSPLIVFRAYSVCLTNVFFACLFIRELEERNFLGARSKVIGDFRQELNASGIRRFRNSFAHLDFTKPEFNALTPPGEAMITLRDRNEKIEMNLNEMAALGQYLMSVSLSIGAGLSKVSLAE